MRALFAGFALACLVGPAMATDGCKPISDAKQFVAAHDGEWIELNADQWQFMRGISVLAPGTPEGLAPGDKAALGRIGEGGVVFFLEDGQACWPIVAKKELIDLLNQVGEGKIGHIGDGT